MKKRDMAVAAMKRSRGLFICPLCRGLMDVDASQALRCPCGHTFDIASPGYVNLLAKPVLADYGADMLEARRRVCEAGFFDGLLAQVVSIIVRYVKASGKKVLTVLDAGCGEGSHLARICTVAKDMADIDSTGVGIDISKEGVRIAAREHTGMLWLVADLARLPLADGSVDVILNILSPSNYGEFQRVLKADGLVIKAVPGEGYLGELRRSLYEGDDRGAYSNDRTVDLFEKSFTVDEGRCVTGCFAPPQGLWPDIVAMTPLTWGRDVQALLDNPKPGVTLDFMLMVGKNREMGSEP